MKQTTKWPVPYKTENDKQPFVCDSIMVTFVSKICGENEKRFYANVRQWTGFLHVLVIAWHLFGKVHMKYEKFLPRKPIRKYQWQNLCRSQCVKWWTLINLVDANISRDHYTDVIMSAMASQITDVTIVYSTVCSGTDIKTSNLAFVQGIHR